MACRPEFPKLYFTIMGEGQLFEPLLAPLRGLPNVDIRRGFIPMVEIPKLHQDHGVFLCPTREDSHGVSMCEAMSSGLVPVTSDSSAIPEFVDHRESGILTRNVNEIVEALERLSSDPVWFQKISEGAARQVRAKCAKAGVIDQELAVIEGAGEQ